MSDLKYPEWQHPLQQALLESDLERLRRKLKEVEKIVARRLRQIGNGAASLDERLALSDAMGILRVLLTVTTPATA